MNSDGFSYAELGGYYVIQGYHVAFQGAQRNRKNGGGLAVCVCVVSCLRLFYGGHVPYEPTGGCV